MTRDLMQGLGKVPLTGQKLPVQSGRCRPQGFALLGHSGPCGARTGRCGATERIPRWRPATSGHGQRNGAGAAAAAVQRQVSHGRIFVEELTLFSVKACFIFRIISAELHFDVGYPGTPERSS